MPARRYPVGPSVRVVAASYGHLVVSSPHPIHRGTLTYSRVIGRWVADAFTLRGADTVRTFPRRERTEALQWLSAIVGAAYRRDMRGLFTPPQRLAMGRNLCPAYVDCADPEECSVTRRDHRHLCHGAPESPLTVYCPDHDKGGAYEV